MGAAAAGQRHTFSSCGTKLHQGELDSCANGLARMPGLRSLSGVRMTGPAIRQHDQAPSRDSGQAGGDFRPWRRSFGAHTLA